MPQPPSAAYLSSAAARIPGRASETEMSGSLERPLQSSWQLQWRIAKSRPRPWTAEEVRTLRSLLQQGLSWDEIAKSMKRGTEGLKHRARFYGMDTKLAGSQKKGNL
jgi:hypothetical protein